MSPNDLPIPTHFDPGKVGQVWIIRIRRTLLFNDFPMQE